MDLARALGVTKRTIYRDIDVLRASGLPIEGERGIGYTLAEPVTLPPLSLTTVELEALQLGLAVVAEAQDEELSAAAVSLAGKLEPGLPDAGPRPGFATPPVSPVQSGLTHLPTLRAAIRARQMLRLTVRGNMLDVRPLGLEFRGRAWVLVCWCHAGFELVRVDGIEALEALPELFVDEPGRTLADFSVLGAHPRAKDPG